MSTTLKVRYLIATCCIALSACTEKTTVQEVPAGNMENAVSSATIDQVSGTATAAPSQSPATNPIGVVTPLPQAPVLNTPVPNMVDGATPTASIDTDGQNNTSNIPITAPGTGLSPATNISDSSGSELLADPAIPVITDNELLQNSVNPIDSADQLITGLPAPTGADSDLLSDPTLINTTDIDANNSTSVPTDPDLPLIVGSAGTSVDCQLTLPCRWVSDDTQFWTTVTNADNIGKQNRLTIEYSVSASHDSQVFIANTMPAVDDAGSSLSPTALKLGEGLGRVSQPVTAGSATTANIEFSASSAASSVSTWSIGISDSGLVRQPMFTNIPIGSVTLQSADCLNTLPCVWESPSRDTIITLLSVNGVGASNQLTANFRVTTTRNTVVAVDKGATATGMDGMSYEGRTHALGLTTGSEKLTANAMAGVQIVGTVYFFRTQTMSDTLQNLTLKVYEDRPYPRWNPSFTAVPVQ